MEYLRERTRVLEMVLIHNGLVVPPVVSTPGSISRTNGSDLCKSPGQSIFGWNRELPFPSTSGNNLKEPYSQHWRPLSLSPSAQHTVLPPPSSISKLIMSSNRLDPLPSSSRNQLSPIVKSGRVPSPLRHSPVSEDERQETRRSHEDRRSLEDKDDKMDVA